MPYRVCIKISTTHTFLRLAVSARQVCDSCAWRFCFIQAGSPGARAGRVHGCQQVWIWYAVSLYVCVHIPCSSRLFFRAFVRLLWALHQFWTKSLVDDVVLGTVFVRCAHSTMRKSEPKIRKFRHSHRCPMRNVPFTFWNLSVPYPLP